MPPVIPFIPLILAVVSVAMTVVSIMMKPKRKGASSQTQSTEGYKVVTDGQSAYLPIVYGRALIGGIRVRTHVSDMMRAGVGVPASLYTVNASKSFHSVMHTTQGGSYTVSEYNAEGVLAPRSISWGYPYGGLMLDNWLDLKFYTFLFMQQALCVGPIHRVADMSVDDGGSPREAKYGTIKDELDTFGRFEPNAALMVDVYYGYGTAWPFELNFPDINTGGSSATFDGMAYAAACFRLSDAVQFSGTPSLQFFVEGRLVSKVVDGVLQTAKVYTNNPAWCLLDYLLDNESGRGVHPEDINLISFEETALICDTIVQTGVTIKGRMNQPLDPFSPGAITRYTRDLPLYECNLVIDTSRPIRDNIETILGTMGDARLVWSGGIYKLKLQYPVNLPGPVTSTIITDDDIILGEPLSLAWPTSSERLNFCTVKFMDEDLDFKENSVSWPDKFDQTALYNTYLAEDGGLQLESEISADGTVDRYHALAIAEEAVRTSRSTVHLTLTYAPREFILEPADYFVLTSEALGVTDMVFKVSTAKMSPVGDIQIDAERFDPSMLAWSTKYSEAPPVIQPLATYPPIAVNFTTTVVGSTVSWDSFTTLSAEGTTSHPASSAVWTTGILYTYLLDGSVLTTTDLSVASTGTIISSYSPETGASNTPLLPPTSVTGSLGSTISWVAAIGAIKYSIDIIKLGLVVRTLVTSRVTVTYTDAQLLEDFGTKPSSVLIKVRSVDSLNRLSLPVEATITATLSNYLANPIIVPVNAHALGTTPYVITMFELPAGVYSNISAVLGCAEVDVSAILTLESSGAILATVTQLGVPVGVNIPSITLTTDTVVSLKLRSSVAGEYAFVLGLVIQ
jgi:hypothetical protein